MHLFIQPFFCTQVTIKMTSLWSPQKVGLYYQHKAVDYMWLSFQNIICCIYEIYMPALLLRMRAIVFASHVSEASVAGEETLDDQIKDILEATEEDHTGKLILFILISPLNLIFGFCGPLYNTHRCHK